MGKLNNLIKPTEGQISDLLFGLEKAKTALTYFNNGTLSLGYNKLSDQIIKFEKKLKKIEKSLKKLNIPESTQDIKE